jgi:hypothetical protein
VKRAIQPSINEPSPRPEAIENRNGASVLFAGAYRPQADSAAHAEPLARVSEQRLFGRFSHPSI